MPQVYDATRAEMQRLEEREQWEREDQQLKAQREHEYRVAKLKYSTAGKFRLWGRVLVGFAKAPAWVILAFRAKQDLPDHWKKFLDI